MALSNFEDRERIKYEDAKKLVKQLILKANKLNSEIESNGGRVFVESMKIFGSYQDKSKDVGDIDLLIELTSYSDTVPDDLDEEDAILEVLKFNEYFSFHTELGTYTLKIEPETIFTR